MLSKCIIHSFTTNLWMPIMDNLWPKDSYFVVKIICLFVLFPENLTWITVNIFILTNWRLANTIIRLFCNDIEYAS